MQAIGIIGLGRMGGNIARRVVRYNHRAIACDREHHGVAGLAQRGAAPAAGLELGYGRRPRGAQYARILRARWAAYAEVLDVPKNARCEPEAGSFNLDVADIAEVWRRGIIITSWLLNLAASALANDRSLDTYCGFVEESGHGWTERAANEAAEVDVLCAALFARFLSRRFAEKTLSAMRKGFGQPKALQP